MDALVIALIVQFLIVTEANVPRNSTSFTLAPIGKFAPIAIETVSNSVDLDCSATIGCNHGAWTDFGLALSGIISKQEICYKYRTSTSCVTRILTSCRDFLDVTTEKMLDLFKLIVVSWCYDDGKTLAEMDKHFTCYSTAFLDSLIIDNCLLKVSVPHSITGISSSNDQINNVAGMTHLLANFLGSYQSSTIVCLYKAISKACGSKAANLALGPAIRQLRPDIMHPKMDDDDSVLSKASNFSAKYSHNSTTVNSEKSTFSDSNQSSASLFAIVSLFLLLRMLFNLK